MVETVSELLMKRISGEIIVSNNHGEIMRRWREVFGITQLEISNKLEISPSVISDYEGGRRKNPGATFVRRFVQSLIEIDSANEGRVLKQFSSLVRTSSDAILDLYEFPSPISLTEIVKAVDGDFLACDYLANKKVLGYTVVDSIKAILTMSGSDFMQLLGTTSERAIIFTKVSTGRSPMVAIRVTPLKPAAVIIHGVTNLDKIAVELAKSERLPLILAKKPSVSDLIKSLHSLRE
jgi:putative transcriptional regulator